MSERKKSDVIKVAIGNPQTDENPIAKIMVKRGTSVEVLADQIRDALSAIKGKGVKLRSAHGTIKLF